MNKDNTQNLSLLPAPRNLNEFNILQAYHDHLMKLINEMELHPIYIENVQKVLKAAIKRVVFQENETMKPKDKASLFSFFSKKER